jgi:hypothetical protein
MAYRTVASVLSQLVTYDYFDVGGPDMAKAALSPSRPANAFWISFTSRDS